MTRKLTETAVRRAGVPTIGQTMIWDQAVTGFAVRILPGGSRTFWFLYRTSGGRSGKNRMVRIGSWPTVSLNAARKAARDLAGQVARGQDPAAKRQEAKRRDSSTLRPSSPPMANTSATSSTATSSTPRSSSAASTAGSTG